MTCADCRRNLDVDEVWVCERCRLAAVDRLWSLVGPKGWYTLLVETGSDVLHPMTRTGGGGGSELRSRRSPVALGAMNLLAAGGPPDKLHEFAVEWYSLRGFTPPPTPGKPVVTRTVVDLDGGTRRVTRGSFDNTVQRLVDSSGWAADNYGGWREFSQYLRRTVAECRVSVDPDSATRMIPVGKCPVEGCGVTLKVDPTSDVIKCFECGSVWFRSEWVKLGASIAR